MWGQLLLPLTHMIQGVQKGLDAVQVPIILQIGETAQLRAVVGTLFMYRQVCDPAGLCEMDVLPGEGTDNITLQPQQQADQNPNVFQLVLLINTLLASGNNRHSGSGEKRQFRSTENSHLRFE